MLYKLLTHNGFEVLTAENGKVGVENALKFKPDLILMDLMMPDMDGCRAAEIIGDHPDCRDIPILLLTCVVSDDYRVFSRTIGIKEYLNKPFKIKDLLEKIRFHLSLVS